MKLYICISFFFCGFILSCSNSKQKQNIVAKIDGEAVYSNELEPLIQQEIFDELNRIHQMKNAALNQLVDNKLINREARRRQLEYENYKSEYIASKIASYGIDSLYKRYNIKSENSRLHSKELYNVSDETFEGRMSKVSILEACIIGELIDSLKSTSQIDNYLYPPKSPVFNLKDLYVYNRGDLLSDVSMVIISDFDCEKCIEAHPLYNSIYEEYKDRVSFSYINFSATATLAQIACDAANEQQCFWEFHDLLYSNTGIIDSSAVYNIAQRLNLDKITFKRDLESIKRKDNIENTIHKLVSMGIYATPTVVINGRLIVNSGSREEIVHLIDLELGNL